MKVLLLLLFPISLFAQDYSALLKKDTSDMLHNSLISIIALAAANTLKLTDPTRPPSASYRFLAGNNTTNIYMSRTINNQDLAAGNVTIDMTSLGFPNVQNTSDANKPVSTAQQTALNLKVNIADTGTQMNPYRAAMINQKGYTLSFQALTSSPTDAQTVYFGNLPKAPVTGQGTSRVYIRKAGIIKIAEIYCQSGTAGTNEAWVLSIRLNNSGDTQIASVSLNTAERVWSNTSLSIAVAAGDYIEIKSTNPTWATNPLTTIFGGYVYIE